MQHAPRNDGEEDTSSNVPPYSHIEKARAAIRECDFVAIDLEFSGLFTRALKQKTPERFYAHCAENVPKFLTVQLGICTAKRSSEDSQRWVLSPFNFYVYPTRRHQFLCDTSAISFLKVQGFDFNRWITEGHDYCSLSLLEVSSMADQQQSGTVPPGNGTAPPPFMSSLPPKFVRDIRINGLQSLIATIIESEKPVVLHNGFLDLMHLHEKFIGALPASLEEFSYEVLRLFIGGVYDTKRIAESSRLTIFHLNSEMKNRTSLSSLKYNLSLSPHRTVFELDPSLSHTEPGHYSLTADVDASCLSRYRSHHGCNNTRSTDTLTTTASTNSALPKFEESPLAAPGKDHEAGYDAFVTAQVFLLELEKLCESSTSEAAQPTTAVLSPARDTTDMKVESNPTGQTSDASRKKRKVESHGICTNWKEISLVTGRRNEIELVGIPPGFFNIEEYSKMYEHAIQPMMSIPPPSSDDQSITALSSSSASSPSPSTQELSSNVTMTGNTGPSGEYRHFGHQQQHYSYGMNRGSYNNSSLSFSDRYYIRHCSKLDSGGNGCRIPKFRNVQMTFYDNPSNQTSSNGAAQPTTENGNHPPEPGNHPGSNNCGRQNNYSR